MIPLVPLAGVDRRLAWLRGILLLATALGLIASAPAWSNTRSYPLLPIVSGFPVLPAPWDHLLFGAMLLALVAALWVYRAAVIIFLITSFLSYCGDQNRGQPWLYMYWVMLLLTLTPRPTALAACRWALAAVYLWGGIQKCNARFFQVVPEWFVSPAAQWHLPTFALNVLRWSAASAPFLEIAIAISLWFAPTRRSTLAAIVGLHLFAVLFLGPLGHNYNWVVWPWNLAMIALALVLFPTRPHSHDASPSLRASWKALLQSRLALAVTMPFMLLPGLSFFGKWDSSLSFALYSESTATANIFVTQAFVDRLPPELRKHVVPFPDFDPVAQGPFLFNPGPWGLEEMHVPPSSEPRASRSVFKALRPYAPQPSDLRMIIGDRAGRVTFYQGDDSWPLQPK